VQVEESICYSKGMDAVWIKNADQDPDQHYQFFASDTGMMRQFPGDARQPPDYQGPTPNDRCSDPPNAMATTQLLGLLGKEQADLAVTAADCRTAGFTCAQCETMGFETGCVCGADEKSSGVLRSSSEYCTWYDPRTKPWYVQGVTGPKDVVLVMDVSGSMNRPLNDIGEAPIDIAKKAAKAVLSTLTSADRVEIVLFSSEKKQHGDKLLPATPANKRLLEAWVDEEVRAAGGTKFDVAFGAAFELFKRSALQCDSEISNEKQNRMSVILFMTDGQDGSTASAGELTAQNTAYDAVIFTYTLGEQQEISGELEEFRDDKPYDIACGNNGKWTRVESSAELVTAMEFYFEFLQVTLAPTRSRAHSRPPCTLSTAVAARCERTTPLLCEADG
jgi:hypothetical protein